MVDLSEAGFSHELGDEILKKLRIKEQQLAAYTFRSPQLGYRRYLVDWMAVLSERMALSPLVLPLAVRYLDTFMDKYSIPSDAQLNLLALCCLTIAAKIEEHEENIPRLSSFGKLLQQSFSATDFIRTEVIVMESLHWKLMLPTALHFLDIFLQKGVAEDDFHCGKAITKIYLEKAQFYLHKYSCYFLEVSLQDHAFLKFLPSLICASSIGAARLCLKIEPCWPERLIEETSYTYVSLSPCIEALMRIHDKEESRNRKESHAG